jgi:hypothetical protein
MAPRDDVVEDLGVGRDSPQSVFFNEFFQFTGSDHLSSQKVQPDALTEILDLY